MGGWRVFFVRAASLRVLRVMEDMFNDNHEIYYFYKGGALKNYTHVPYFHVSMS